MRATNFNTASAIAPQNQDPQLPLVECLALGHAPETSNAPVPRNARGPLPDRQQLAALQMLLQGPVPLDQLTRAVGAANGNEVLIILRQLGLQVPVRQVPVLDFNYDVLPVNVCALTIADVRRIHRMLTKAGGRDV